MRGVADGGNGNHSGPEPSVGTYLDELPVTTIGGTLDMHVYDVARLEVLPGPQGTLYGASSEAGTLRIITNKPSTSVSAAGLTFRAMSSPTDQKAMSWRASSTFRSARSAAIRIVAFDEHDAGYIDNVPGQRYFPSAEFDHQQLCLSSRTTSTASTRSAVAAALKYDLNNNWTITPSVDRAGHAGSMACSAMSRRSAISRCSVSRPTAITIAGCRRA